MSVRTVVNSLVVEDKMEIMPRQKSFCCSGFHFSRMCCIIFGQRLRCKMKYLLFFSFSFLLSPNCVGAPQCSRPHSQEQLGEWQARIKHRQQRRRTRAHLESLPSPALDSPTSCVPMTSIPVSGVLGWVGLM